MAYVEENWHTSGDSDIATTTKHSCCIWSPQNQRRDSALGRRGCIAGGYPRKARENKRSHTDSISPSLAPEGALHK